ncbi:hypothetical protein GDO86_020153 [Hymenochirus boettgeri]|uniref:Uncharacterized protein n=1 Tax=Hymenochirus boettgeri TaxID=247094 RepID=A0A8T2ILS0_9PIPI|nr:hypothetical protein GDO86_020153 [Hymenochirus boettgeri]
MGRQDPMGSGNPQLRDTSNTPRVRLNQSGARWRDGTKRT